MKKTTIIILFLTITLTAFANPLAKLYQVDDPIFEVVEELSIEVGVVPFTSSGPVSGYELKEHLNKLAEKTYDSSIKNKIKKVSDYVNNPFNDKIWNFGFEANIEAYNNTDNSAKFYDWVEHYNSRLPIVSTEVETIFGNNGYAIFAYGLKKAFSKDDFNEFSTNLPFGKGSGGFEDSYPNTAFLSVSGNWFTFIAGRDSIKIGRGATGNLMVNDHSPYHDFFALNIFNKKFRYSFLAIPMNELVSDSILTKLGLSDSYLGTARIPLDSSKYWFTFMHGAMSRTYISHRLEFDIFDWWRLSITEGTMFYLDSYDLRMLNPLMLNHNLQSFGEVNNSIGLEAEFAISKNWALDFQFFLDQLQTKQEQEAYTKIPPNAYAFLLNTRYSYSSKDWVFNGFVEGVYTSPFAYMRAGDNTSNYGDGLSEKEYNLDFVHAVSRADIYSGVNWLGYPYGPDTIVVATDFTSAYKDMFSLTANLRFIVQGERGLIIHNKKQDVHLYGQGENINPVTPSGKNPEYSFIVGIGGSYKIPKVNISINLKNYFVNKWKGNNFTFDNQLTFGINYRF